MFYAHSTAEVSAAVGCAFSAGVKVAPACGRQGFTGRSVQNDYLTVDISNITQVCYIYDLPHTLHIDIRLLEHIL